MRRFPLLLPVLLLAACGEVGMGAPAPSQPSVRQVLLEPPEQVEALSVQARAELYRTLLRESGAGTPDGLLALFPMVQDGAVRAAPPIEGRDRCRERPSRVGHCRSPGSHRSRDR